jgi:hypothetical protein
MVTFVLGLEDDGDDTDWDDSKCPAFLLLSKISDIIAGIMVIARYHGKNEVN